jgi:hypothetical protein
VTQSDPHQFHQDFPVYHNAHSNRYAPCQTQAGATKAAEEDNPLYYLMEE